MGLGLALVKKLVEMHGGKIAASAPGRARGASLSFGCRCWREARTVAAPRRQALAAILLVDDHEDIASSMGELLTQLGYDARRFRR